MNLAWKMKCYLTGIHVSILDGFLLILTCLHWRIVVNCTYQRGVHIRDSTGEISISETGLTASIREGSVLDKG